MRIDNRIWALLAATAASAIYGINHTLAKSVMPEYIQPFGFILLRVTGAGILFWLLSLLVKRERILKKDYPRLLACAFLGMFVNMLAFFEGLSLSTPINSSVVITLSPVMLLLLSIVFLKEKVGWKKYLGIGIGLGGALVLILFGSQQQQNAPNIPLGNLMFVLNASAYAGYLILVKPLTERYHVITLMKWLFLFGTLFNLPFTFSAFSQVSWSTLPTEVILIFIYVVLGTTFLTYLLNIYALKTLKASTIGAFIYLQPLIAVVFATVMGADRLTPIRAIAGLLIFFGVYLSSRKSKEPSPKNQKINS